MTEPTITCPKCKTEIRLTESHTRPIFFRQRIKPFYRKANSARYIKVDGEPQRWELKECLRRFYGNNNPPVRKNLEFFIDVSKLEPTSIGQMNHPKLEPWVSLGDLGHIPTHVDNPLALRAERRVQGRQSSLVELSAKEKTP